MHVAILTLDFPPDIGGVQNYLFQSAAGLAKWCSVSIITPVAGCDPGEDNLQRIVLSSIGSNAFLRKLVALNPDYVLVGHAHPRLLLAALLYGKFGLIVHGNDFLAAQNRWHRPFFNGLLRQANPLVAVSQEIAGKLETLGIQTDAVIRPGVDTSRFSPRPSAVSTPLTLLTIARLVPRKGIDTVLKSLPTLLQTFPDLQYHIGGQGPDLKRLQSLVGQLNVGANVKFLGRIPDDFLPDVYRSADIFVMPARETVQQTSIEGFGIVFLEASASGLPVVASASGGIPEAVLDGETGLLVKPDDVSELTDVLKMLLASPEERRNLGNNGRFWVEQNMTWDQTALNLAQALGIDVA